MNINNFEDALIIHLMYALVINPKTIALLIFDSIAEENFISYFDKQSSEYHKIQLTESLERY